MIREILLASQCAALAPKHGIFGLQELADERHTHRLLNTPEGEPCAMEVAKAFFHDPASGESGVFFAVAGAQTHEEDGMEGLRFTYEPHEAAEAECALLAELGEYGPQFIADDLAERRRDALVIV